MEVDDAVPVFAVQKKLQRIWFPFQELALRQLVQTERCRWMDMILLQCSRVVEIRHEQRQDRKARRIIFLGFKQSADEVIIEKQILTMPPVVIDDLRQRERLCRTLALQSQTQFPG